MDPCPGLGASCPSALRAANSAYYNSVAIIDAEAANWAFYGNSHIPDGVGYKRNSISNPGRTLAFAAGRPLMAGLVWESAGTQWFPNAPAAWPSGRGGFALSHCHRLGAAGSPLDSPTIAARHQVMPVPISCPWLPRTGSVETGESFAMTFYGNSFIAGATRAGRVHRRRRMKPCSSPVSDLDDLRAGAGWVCSVIAAPTSIASS